MVMGLVYSTIAKANNKSQAEFCNPGLLGTSSASCAENRANRSVDDYQTFRHVYEIPILKSRAPGATEKEIEVGEGRMEQVCFHTIPTTVQQMDV